jgi:hypothetical protein
MRSLTRQLVCMEALHRFWCICLVVSSLDSRPGDPVRISALAHKPCRNIQTLESQFKVKKIPNLFITISYGWRLRVS